ncbi:O-antigen polymerase [Parabacteroides pacaensis]|uniref:O-antigen polymerase n=1 Tax=Parabacteroides pacaensis TaxID=2086575 RepID=UPI000D10B8A2|nr:O-antigen polymerase [Parabacteroides pacaensis]
MPSNQALILNIVIWGLTLILFYRRRKPIDSAVFLLSTFFIFSVCSYLIYNVPYGGFRGERITLLPLLYLYVMIMLTMSPILRFNIQKIETFPDPPFKVLDILVWGFIICMIIKLPSDLMRIQDGISTIMLDQGRELYSDVMNESRINGGAYIISSLPTIYTNLTTEIILLIAFYNFYKKRKKKLTTVVLIALAFTPFSSLANGQRGGAFDVIIIAIGTYFLFAPLLENKIRRIAKITGIVFLVGVLVPTVALTKSRFGSSDNFVLNSVYSYMGQQNLNFDIYAFDNNGLRYGDRVFPLFKKMLGFEDVPDDFWQRRKKYPNLKINDEVFIGYIGDFLLDFGPWISTILFIVFTSIFLSLTKLRHRKCEFYQLLVIQFVLTLGLQGGLKLYPFADTFGLKIFSFGLLYIYLKLYKQNKLNHRIVLPNSKAIL